MRAKKYYLSPFVFILILLSISACGGNGDLETPLIINTPPSVNAGIDQSVAEESTVQLSGSGSDLEGPINFTWLQISGASVIIENSSSSIANFQAPIVDSDKEIEFSLTVTDSGGLTATDNVTITVLDSAAANTPPSSNAGVDQSVNEEEIVNLVGTGADAEGSVSYLWDQTAGLTVVINNQNMANANFTAPLITEDTVLTFDLIVIDEEGVSSRDSIDINILDIPTVPSTTFNRRITAMHVDLDFNGGNDAEQLYLYNSNNTLESSTYIYTDDGVVDIDYDKFPYKVGNKNETQTFTYDLNNNVSNWDLVKPNSSFNLDFVWNSPGKISTSRFDISINGILQNRTDFTINYNDGLVTSVQGTGEDLTVDLVLDYDSNGVLLSDLQTSISNGLVKSQRNFTWNSNGAIGNIFEFDPDPEHDFTNNTVYSYENDRLIKVINDSTEEPYAWNYSYDTEGLLASITIDLGNNGQPDAILSFEWESTTCSETNLWLLRGVIDSDKRLDDELLSSLGDGHFTFPVCGYVAP